MTVSLAQLQSEFGDALRYQSQGEHCQIVSDHFSAEQRLQIYRNNFIISLVDVLKAAYPLVDALVGDECFTQLARQHALVSPPNSGDVTSYGLGFSQTFYQFPAVIEAAPYLPDTAEFEWCCDAANPLLGKAYPEKIQPLAALAQVSEEQHPKLSFILNNQIVLFHSEFALYTLRQTIKSEQLDALNINQPEFGFIRHLPNNQVETQIVSQACYELLACIADQRPLGQTPPEHLSHLNTLIELDVIAGFFIQD